MMDQSSLETTVIVVTLNRPNCLRRCLECLRNQQTPPAQVIVVDASMDDKSRHVAESFQEVLYIKAPQFFGDMTASRNRGLLEARGEIIAFLDDDAYAHPGWLKALLAAYDDPQIGGVGGRALNGQPGEETYHANQIGRLLPNGFLTGNFAADSGKIIEVDHLIGCNMSFRREVLACTGGFREDFRGISGICEDTDLCLRIKALGYSLRFQPEACVDHEGAPQSIGQRFNARYQFYHRRNSCVMLIRYFGISPVLWRFPLSIAWQSGRELARGIASAAGRFAASAAGMVAGMARGAMFYLRDGTDPVRRNEAGEAVRKALQAQAALTGRNHLKKY